MGERKVVISTSMSKKVIEILERYEGEDVKFKYIENTSPLNAVFQVATDEMDNEKLVRKIKNVVKADPMGSVLYFTVTVE